MDWFLITIGALLFIFSIIDWKVGAIPSILLTATLFTIAFLNPANLWFGIMAFIVSLLLYEADYFSGVADIKIMTMLGFMIHTTNWLFALIVLVMVYGFVWKVLIKWRKPKAKEVPFVPVFFFVYITLFLLGGII